MQETNDGGIIMVGQTNSFGAGYGDIYVIRTDIGGNLLWSKTYGGSQGDIGLAVQKTLDGGYAIGGTTNSFGAGNSDLYLIKIDSIGTIEWSKTYGGTAQEQGYSLKETSDGGFIFVGLTTSFSPDTSDVFVIKTDINGDTLWSKVFGGIHTNEGHGVCLDFDGGYAIAANSGSFTSVPSNGYVIKTDANGNSGCNERTVSPLVTNPSTISTNCSTIVSSTPTVIGIPSNSTSSNVFTDQLLCFTTDVSELSLLRYPISIYPNPTPSNSQITLTYPAIGTARELVVNDINGKEVAHYSLPQWSTTQTVKLPEMGKGIYVARMVGEGTTSNAKLVVQ